MKNILTVADVVIFVDGVAYVIIHVNNLYCFLFHLIIGINLI